MSEYSTALKSFEIRFDDLEWFGDLPIKEKAYIRKNLELFSRLHQADVIKKEAKLCARQCAHLGRGWSEKGIMDRYRKFKGSGYNPKTLVRDWGNGKDKLPEEFIKFWKKLAYANKRNDGCKGAYRIFIEEYWAAGESIPPVKKYGTWQSWFMKTYPNKTLPRFCPTDKYSLPEGWTYGNLMRYIPSQRERVQARKGFKAAHDFQIQVKRDRSNLLPMQLLAFDDCWIDQYAHSPHYGNGKAFRPISVNAICVATGTLPGRMVKPRVADANGKFEGIRKVETGELLGQILASKGMPPYPVNVMAENASADFTKDTKAWIKLHFGDRLVISNTDCFKDLLMEHGFIEQGGKPWQKTWIENFFRIMHTTAGHLPGQTGSSYDDAPANLNAILKYTNDTLGEAALKAEDIEKLKLPVMRFEDLVNVYDRLIRILEMRTDHRMHGFGKVTEWRLEKGDPWQPETRLTEVSRDLVPLLEIRTRMESPMERWHRLSPPRDKWSEVPDTLLWGLMPEVKPRKIKHGRVTIHDQRLGVEPIEFYCENHPVLKEREGASILAYYTSSDPDRIMVTTDAPLESRQFLGTIPRWDRVDITDQEAINKAAGAVHRDRMRELDTIRDITAEENEQLKNNKQYNQWVIDQAKERQGPKKISKSTAKKLQDEQRKRFAEEAALAREDDLDLDTF